VHDRQRAVDAAPDVDEALYGGFVGNNDRRLLNQLRAMAPQKLAAAQPNFDDVRLEELLFRYRARNFPDTLSEDEHERWQQLRAERLFEGRDGYLTMDAYMERIDQLGAEAAERGDARAERVLGALHDYAEMVAPE